MSPPYAPGYNLKQDRVRSKVETFLELRRTTGWSGAIKGVAEWTVVRATYNRFHRGMSFAVGSERFQYLDFPNHTERVIEVPWALGLIPLEHRRRGACLEIGNTLNKWSPFEHDILDFYERGQSIINEDVETFSPAQKYPVIVSVSTLEHVGRDEPVSDPHKFERSVQNILRNCLDSHGIFLATLPLGYNPEVDRFVISGHLRLGQMHVMVRDSILNTWSEIDMAFVPRMLATRPNLMMRYLASNQVGFWRVEL